MKSIRRLFEVKDQQLSQAIIAAHDALNSLLEMLERGPTVTHAAGHAFMGAMPEPTDDISQDEFGKLDEAREILQGIIDRDGMTN